MLSFAETGQVSVDSCDGGALVAKVDLDLTEVLALLQQMGRVGMAKAVNVRALLDSAGTQGQAESSLERGAIQRFGGGGGALAAVAFGREKSAPMPMSLPLFSEQVQGALRQGDIAVGIAFARANVQEHALGIHIGTWRFKPSPRRRPHE